MWTLDLVSAIGHGLLAVSSSPGQGSGISPPTLDFVTLDTLARFGDITDGADISLQGLRGGDEISVFA